MLFLATSSIFDNISSDLISALVATAVTVVTGYIVIRERILKTEIKIENIYNYIDGRNELFDAKVKDLQNDISDFKEINKEASKSLAENTAAIKELKFVLTVLQEQLSSSKNKKPSKDTDL